MITVHKAGGHFNTTFLQTPLKQHTVELRKEITMYACISLFMFVKVLSHAGNLELEVVELGQVDLLLRHVGTNCCVIVMI